MSQNKSLTNRFASIRVFVALVRGEEIAKFEVVLARHLNNFWVLITGIEAGFDKHQ